MTTTLQELDEVLAKVVDNQFDNILDASRVGVDCAIFLKDHAPKIRAALELQAKVEDLRKLQRYARRKNHNPRAHFLLEPNKKGAWVKWYDVVSMLKAAPPATPEASVDETPIYYMRDNHTFKRLSNSVSVALVEIETEFNDGYTHGMLCSKRKGFKEIHATGSANRVTFLAECHAALLNAAPPAQEEQS